ncbi:MAG TPA: SDR family oxidoreductase [Thiobacillus sp.]|nr:MAG: NAD-dependent dehydratase [Hydrogenophilales bacterium 28-61-11]OYZ59119.1 MAG: NAD-dependent dehydratase [Hydrogenophilales bacterium 16-61-112]OZA46460.1 MAG: NAD-dependent dehydratase [Hydrogenophilales bacterium 17-61-76]HQT31479.1 SDR family oxidoreductase [Thiobacillus sp.]HQT70625.1 SDR family oxidoreductase [Thiobacillus sp.]
MKVLVTGANGFVGRFLCECLKAHGHVVIPVVRRVSSLAGEVVVGSINGETDWASVLADCDAVAHLSARVHVMNEDSHDPLALYRATNTDATLNLARQAAQAGVKRFVFISTIKVNGEGRDVSYRETDAAAPMDAYAISKWEAEQGLQQIAADTGLEVVILRPPLVYGPGVKANFLRLMQVIKKGWPLPLGAIRNRRSLLYLGNFVDAIRVCIEHPAAAGQTFLLDDGEPVSTPELIRAVAKSLGRPARLLAVPVGVLELAGALLGKRAAVARLTGSLYVDSSVIRSRLGWTPPFSMEVGLAATVAPLT